MVNFSIDFITRQNELDNTRLDSPDMLSPDMHYDSLSSSESTSSLNRDSGSISSDGSDSISQALLSLENCVSQLSPSPSSSSSSSSSSEKPGHSYIALISMSILDKPNRKVVLGDIYQYIMDNFPYYSDKSKAWKNSIRHNLSLNECFVKSGRADNGKGNYWSIHPACVDDFVKGDFRRRHARRRARKSTGKDTNVFNGSPAGFHYNKGYVPMTPTTIASSLGMSPYSSPVMYPSSLYSGLYPTTAQAMYAPVPTSQTSYAPVPTSQTSYAPANISAHDAEQNWICDIFKNIDIPVMNQMYPSVCY